MFDDRSFWRDENLEFNLASCVYGEILTLWEAPRYVNR